MMHLLPLHQDRNTRSVMPDPECQGKKNGHLPVPDKETTLQMMRPEDFIASEYRQPSALSIGQRLDLGLRG
ncbi:MAG TPA: hypothetical protein DF427_01780 [Moraxellaceae bacterium]|nr:hypothetical protein [Moraxellaceae bacterium]